MARTVDLRTELPGPKSRAIMERKERVVAEAKTVLAPFVIDHAHGCVVTDVDGNTLLDWSGGIGCLNVGPYQRRGRGGPARPGRPLPAHRFHGRAL